MDETCPQSTHQPLRPSKLCVEHMLSACTPRAYGLRRFAALRYFNVAGADPDGDIGEDHDPETHLIPLAACWRRWAAARRSRSSASDYDTPDGTCVRDYVHVTDLATAHVLAVMERPRAGRQEGLTTSASARASRCAQVIESVLPRVTGHAFEVRGLPSAAPATRRHSLPIRRRSARNSAGRHASNHSTRSWRPRGDGSRHIQRGTGREPRRRRGARWAPHTPGTGFQPVRPGSVGSPSRHSPPGSRRHTSGAGCRGRPPLARSHHHPGAPGRGRPLAARAGPRFRPGRRRGRPRRRRHHRQARRDRRLGHRPGGVRLGRRPHARG
jgi:hypothetical protein